MEHINLLRVLAKKQKYEICHPFYKLYFKWLPLILVALSGIITSKEYYGKPIVCIHGTDKQATEYVEAYCYNKGAHIARKREHKKETSPGVHPLLIPLPPKHIGLPLPKEKDSRKNHRLYKFLWMVPLIQAFILIIPNQLWKAAEGGTIKRIIESRKDNKWDTDYAIQFLQNSRGTRNTYFILYFVCQVLQIISVATCIIICDTLFEGKFIQLGKSIFDEETENAIHIVDLLFPLSTKCTISWFGPSGNIQHNDAVCEMLLNDLYRAVFITEWWLFIIATFLIWPFVFFETFIATSSCTMVSSVTANLRTTKDFPYLHDYGYGVCFMLKLIRRNVSILEYESLIMGLSHKLPK